MTQKRLNNVMLLHAYKNCTDQLNLKEIASKFAGHNTRRKNHFITEFFSYVECMITICANIVLIKKLYKHKNYVFSHV